MLPMWLADRQNRKESRLFSPLAFVKQAVAPIPFQRAFTMSVEGQRRQALAQQSCRTIRLPPVSANQQGRCRARYRQTHRYLPTVFTQRQYAPANRLSGWVINLKKLSDQDGRRTRRPQGNGWLRVDSNHRPQHYEFGQERLTNCLV